MKIAGTYGVGASCGGSYALNYLVYLQNIVLNQSRAEEKSPRFPYLDAKVFGLLEHDPFREQFSQAWERAVEVLIETGGDFIPLGERQGIFQALFEESDGGREGLQESFLSFRTWWQYGGGSYSTTGREQVCQVIHRFVASLFGPVEEDKILRVQLVYDDVRMSQDLVRNWFLVLPVPEIEKVPFTGILSESIQQKIRAAILD